MNTVVSPRPQTFRVGEQGQGHPAGLGSTPGSGLDWPGPRSPRRRARGRHILGAEHVPRRHQRRVAANGGERGRCRGCLFGIAAAVVRACAGFFRQGKRSSSRKM